MRAVLLKVSLRVCLRVTESLPLQDDNVLISSVVCDSIDGDNRVARCLEVLHQVAPECARAAVDNQILWENVKRTGFQ